MNNISHSKICSCIRRALKFNPLETPGYNHDKRLLKKYPNGITIDESEYELCKQLIIIYNKVFNLKYWNKLSVCDKNILVVIYYITDKNFKKYEKFAISGNIELLIDIVIKDYNLTFGNHIKTLLCQNYIN